MALLPIEENGAVLTNFCDKVLFPFSWFVNLLDFFKGGVLDVAKKMLPTDLVVVFYCHFSEIFLSSHKARMLTVTGI